MLVTSSSRGQLPARLKHRTLDGLLRASRSFPGRPRRNLLSIPGLFFTVLCSNSDPLQRRSRRPWPSSHAGAVASSHYHSLFTLHPVKKSGNLGALHPADLPSESDRSAMLQVTQDKAAALRLVQLAFWVLLGLNAHMKTATHVTHGPLPSCGSASWLVKGLCFCPCKYTCHCIELLATSL